jgi:uncharacterized membrane protein
MLAAIGMTVYGSMTGFVKGDDESVLAAVIIAWVNIVTMLLIWALFRYIERDEAYDLINGFDTKRPFDKNILNQCIEKWIDCIVYGISFWTISLIPLLFINNESASSIYLVINCITVPLAWVIGIVVIAVKYQNRAYTDKKD